MVCGQIKHRAACWLIECNHRNYSNSSALAFLMPTGCCSRPKTLDSTNQKTNFQLSGSQEHIIHFLIRTAYKVVSAVAAWQLSHFSKLCALGNFIRLLIMAIHSSLSRTPHGVGRIRSRPISRAWKVDLLHASKPLSISIGRDYLQLIWLYQWLGG